MKSEERKAQEVERALEDSICAVCGHYIQTTYLPGAIKRRCVAPHCACLDCKAYNLLNIEIEEDRDGA